MRHHPRVFFLKKSRRRLAPPACLLLSSRSGALCVKGNSERFEAEEDGLWSQFPCTEPKSERPPLISLPPLLLGERSQEFQGDPKTNRTAERGVMKEFIRAIGSLHFRVRAAVMSYPLPPGTFPFSSAFKLHSVAVPSFFGAAAASLPRCGIRY